MQDHVFSVHCTFFSLPPRHSFGKVVAHRYRETVSSIAVGVSFIGKNTGLQMFEILCVLHYRRF